MPTSLSVYATSTAATTLTSAAKLANALAGTGSFVNTTIGTATGLGELTGLGAASAWLGHSGAITDSACNPTGNGWLWDVTTLEAQEIIAGNWTPAFILWLSQANTIGGTLYCRAYKYNTSGGGTYTQIGSAMSLALSPSLTTTHTTYTFSASSLPLANFGTGDKLYIDCWLNATSNTGGHTATLVAVGIGSATGGVASRVEIDTPGYQVGTTPARDLFTRLRLKATALKDLFARANVAISSDNFVRANTTGSATVGNIHGWGVPSDNPPSGDTWTQLAGYTGGNGVYSISGNTGQYTGSTSPSWIIAKLGTQTFGDGEFVVRWSTTGNGTNNLVGFALRIVDASNYYLIYAYSGTSLAITRVKAGVSVTVGSPVSFAYSANTKYHFRVRFVATTCFVRAWADGSAEPTTWTLTGSDNSFASGSWGLLAQLNAANDVISFDNFAVFGGVTSYRDLTTRMIIKAVGTRDLVARVLIGALKTKDLATRIRLLGSPQHDLAARVRLAMVPLHDIVSRVALQAVSLRDLAARARLAAIQPRDLITRIGLSLGSVLQKDLVSRALFSAIIAQDLAARIGLSFTQGMDIATRARLGFSQIRNLVTRARLGAVPLRNVTARISISEGLGGIPSSPLSPPLFPVMSGDSRPLESIPLLYAVNGVLLPDQPITATTPLLQGTVLPAGATLTLLFSHPTSATQAVLANGSVVTLTFALYKGTMVSGQVSLTSVLTGSMFQVTATLIQTLPFNQWVVPTQFL